MMELIGVLGLAATLVGSYYAYRAYHDKNRFKHRADVKASLVNSGGIAIRLKNNSPLSIKSIVIKLQVLNREKQLPINRWIQYDEKEYNEVQSQRNTDWKIDIDRLGTFIWEKENIDIPDDIFNYIGMPNHAFLLYPKPINLKVIVSFFMEGQKHRRTYVICPKTSDPRCRFLENVGFNRTENYQLCWISKPYKRWKIW